MPEEVNLDNELRKANLHPISLQGASAYRLENRTPAHSFTTVLVHFKELYYFATTARDFFDEGLAKGVFDFVNAHGSDVSLEKSNQILEGFSYQGYGFNAIMILSPQAHRLFRAQSESLHSRTLEVFPIFRCEFSGNETPELIELIRHDFVSSIDWKRPPSPLVRMRFNDTCTGVRSTGKKMGLAKPSLLDDKIRKLADCPGSSIEVENYVGEDAKLIAGNGGYTLALSGSAEQLALTKESAVQWLRVFLISGMKSAVTRHSGA